MLDAEFKNDCEAALRRLREEDAAMTVDGLEKSLRARADALASQKNVMTKRERERVERVLIALYPSHRRLWARVTSQHAHRESAMRSAHPVGRA